MEIQDLAYRLDEISNLFTPILFPPLNDDGLSESNVKSITNQLEMK